METVAMVVVLAVIQEVDAWASGAVRMDEAMGMAPVVVAVLATTMVGAEAAGKVGVAEAQERAEEDLVSHSTCPSRENCHLARNSVCCWSKYNRTRQTQGEQMPCRGRLLPTIAAGGACCYALRLAASLIRKAPVVRTLGPRERRN